MAGEHRGSFPKATCDCIAALHAEVPSLRLKWGPWNPPEYRPLVEAGAEGLVVSQETYDREVYAEMHTSGPKRNFEWRLETPERGYAAGFRRLGMRALFGLADWRFEAICVAAHAQHLLRALLEGPGDDLPPRLRPCAGSFEPRTTMTDRELVQLLCAFRLMFPDIGLVLSTRESAALRDGLMPLGITLVSAGSHTEPGGYTGTGRDELHRTEHGRIVELGASEWAALQPDATTTTATAATGQFNIADERSAAEVADRIRALGSKNPSGRTGMRR